MAKRNRSLTYVAAYRAVGTSDQLSSRARETVLVTLRGLLATGDAEPATSTQPQEPESREGDCCPSTVSRGEG